MAGNYRGSGKGTISNHDLRHTAATLMLKKRVPVNVIAKLLGHSDPTMTLRRHALPYMLEIAAEAKEAYAF